MTYPKAREALKYFFDASYGRLPIKNFDLFVEHYRTHKYSDGSILKHDDFLQELEGALKYSKPQDVKNVMREMAFANPPGRLPKTEEYFKRLGTRAQDLTVTQVATAVKEGVKDTAKVAAVGIGAGLGVYILIAAGALLLPQLMAKMQTKQ